MIALILATALTAAPIYERSDKDGNRFALYPGACAQGPIIAFWKGRLAFNLKVGEDFPPGCSVKGHVR